MQKNINQILLEKDPAAKNLLRLLDENQEKFCLKDSIVYHDFPFYIDDDGKSSRVNLLLVSKYYGIIIFQCSNQTERTFTSEELKKRADHIDQILSLVYSKLVKSRTLRTNNLQLAFDLYTTLYMPNYKGEEFFTEFENIKLNFVTNQEDLNSFFSNNFKPSPLKEDIFNEIIAILEGSKGIIKPKERNITSDHQTKGKILEEIESEIANFDKDQKRAALLVIDNPQRIRGLAGSGKTIVLAMKAAQIHLQDPDAEILYTFWTKSLYSLIKRLITRFYRQFAEKDPNWEKIHIMHAWGGYQLEGVYYNTCINNNIPPIAFKNVKFEKNPFDKLCKTLSTRVLKQVYDYSILDEAQDFPVNFYRLCRSITKNNRVIWGYDECQNILDIELQNVEETFGKDKNGNYYIDFSNPHQDYPQDLVLHKCYRNPRKNLVSAFSLGLGIYNDKIIQMPENNAHWEDLGFTVTKGNSEEGSEMEITRTEENSPLMKTKLLDNESTIKVTTFESAKDECDFIYEKVLQDLDQGLSPDDILIISLDEKNSKRYFTQLERLFNNKSIGVYNHFEIPSNSRTFSLKDNVTMTSVYKAKGNEAGSVYILGVDGVFNNKDSILERNKLFTAITRSVAWVNITGVGPSAEICKQELDKTLANYPSLCFIMPNRESLKIFQRDLDRGQELLNKAEREIEQLSEKLGKSREDLLQDLIDRETSKRLKK